MRVLGMAMALIVRCTSAWEMHLRGQGGLGVSASGLQRVALCCSLRPGPDGRECGWLSGSFGSGAEYPALQSAGASTEEPPSPRVSLILSETCVYSTCVRASFGFVFLSQSVVPKTANPRNHGEADTDSNTRAFIYKLELVSKYTQHSGSGTWTPTWVLAYF